MGCLFAQAVTHTVVTGGVEEKTGLISQWEILSSAFKEGRSVKQSQQRVFTDLFQVDVKVSSEPLEAVQTSEVSPQPPSSSLSLNHVLTTPHVHSTSPHLAWFCWKLHP